MVRIHTQAGTAQMVHDQVARDWTDKEFVDVPMSPMVYSPFRPLRNTDANPPIATSARAPNPQPAPRVWFRID